MSWKSASENGLAEKRIAGSSQVAQPAARLVVGHRGALDALAHARVARQVECGQAGIGLVPDLGRKLVPPQRVLEFLLLLGAVADEPMGARVADAVAEDEIEPPADLVDEIVHVAFEAAVVVAAEQDAPLVV